ncbi:hypothetical protein [Hyphomonas sp.]|uniref:hypothetical protein n=1 Tax=Hyphomonas sp. TaxID=87 RepID=UPI0025C58059|nr:hypothetical protein [Hyphomonas sp.]MBI1400637.1 hypothetical protein [Hyphomonas sp.]
MEQTLPPSRTFSLLASLRAGFGFFVQVMIGAVLIFVASLVAMMTAFAGLMLAAAALMLRYLAMRQTARTPMAVNDGPVTLQARRTPRGWTVE